MKSIWYESIEDVLLNIADPNTWGTVWEVPWVSSPKINAGVSVYNIEATWWWIAWWSTNVSWSASDYDTVAWWSGSIYLPDGTNLSVSSWNTWNMSSTTYIYYDRDLSGVYTTTSASASVWENKILLCVAKPNSSSSKKAEFQAFGTDAQSTFITADQIAANTITANEIASNTITASEIHSWAVTASKIDVSQLSAISANLWTITAGDITGTTITAGSTSWTWIRLNPSSYSMQIYYWWSKVWEIIWWSNGGYSAVILDADHVAMWGRDTMDLYNAKLRIPVWNNLYD